MQNPNVIKTANKLIGDIENRDLYDSDDGILDVNREQLFGGVSGNEFVG